MPHILTTFISSSSATGIGGLGQAIAADPPGLNGVAGPSNLVIDSIVWASSTNQATTQTGVVLSSTLLIQVAGVTKHKLSTDYNYGSGAVATNKVGKTVIEAFPGNTGPRFSGSGIKLFVQQDGTWPANFTFSDNSVTITYHYE